MSESSLSANSLVAAGSEPVAQSALLAIWVNEWALGRQTAEGLIDGLDATGPHFVVEPASNRPIGLLTWLADRGVRPGLATAPCRPVLPIPGDVAGVPGPKAFTQLATAVGDAAIFDDFKVALVPAVSHDGTTWSSVAIQPIAAARNVSRPETANSEIRSALLEATTALADVDFAERRDAVDKQIRQLQHRIDRLTLPTSLPGQLRETVVRSALVLGICSIAKADLPSQPHPAITNSSESVLNDLASTARRCLTAACITR